MKILYVATVVKTHISQFHLPYLRMLKGLGWETAVAAKNDYENPADCVIPFCDAYYDIPFARNPFHPKNFKAYKQLKKLCDDGQYDVIHCHTPVGGVIARLAARNARKKGSKVFYTAHGFHFYKGAPWINWLLYYPVERLMARKTDVLITITGEDCRRAQKFHGCKVEYVPGIGVDCSRFRRGSSEQAASLRAELGIPAGAKVLLSVGEAVANKNHAAVIRVLPELPDVWYVICGSGPLLPEYRAMAESLDVRERLILAGYRKDVPRFYAMADAFVHPSFREGVPVALMEAMASGLPCVASRNRGTDELLPDSQLLFSVKNRDELVEKLRLGLYGDPAGEIARNVKRVAEFDLQHTLDRVKELYLRETSRS